MLVRPHGDDGGLAYPAALEQYLNRRGHGSWLVLNRSRIAGTIEDVARSATEIVSCQPNAVIVHHGYTEALWRPHSRRIWYFEHMYQPPRAAPVILAQRVARKWSAVRSRLRLTEQWVSPRRFGEVLSWLVEYLASETSSRIILIGPTPWSPQVARYAPDSRDAIARFDGIVRATADKSGADYIPFAAFLAAAGATSPDEIVPDGTHFSSLGHRAVTKVLGDCLAAAYKPRCKTPTQALTSANHAPASGKSR